MFELEADGVRFLSSSPVVTQKLLEKGARLVRAPRAEELRQDQDPAVDVAGPATESPATPGPHQE